MQARKINIKKEFKYVLFGDDDQKTSTFHFIAIIAFIVAIALEIYSVVAQVRFDFIGYGIGIGAIVSGLGIGKKLDK